MIFSIRKYSAILYLLSAPLLSSETNVFDKVKLTPFTALNYASIFQKGTSFLSSFEKQKELSVQNIGSFVSFSTIFASFLSYVDRGAVQFHKKRGIGKFTNIKNLSNTLKDSILTTLFSEKGIYAQLLDECNDIRQQFSKGLQEYAAIGTNEPSVIATIQNEIKIKRDALIQEEQTLRAAEQQKEAVYTKQLQEKQNAAFMATQKEKEQLAETKKRQEELLQTVQTKLKTTEEALKKETIRELEKNNENAAFEYTMMQKKNSISNYYELERDFDRLTLLQSFRKNFRELVIAKLDAYYAAQEEWQKKVKEESYFATFKLLVADEPEAVKKAKKEVLTSLTQVVTIFEEEVEKKGLQNSVQGGLSFIKEMIAEEKIASQEEFGTFTKEIIARTETLEKALNDVGFFKVQDTIVQERNAFEQKKRERTSLSVSDEDDTRSIAALKEQFAQEKKAVEEAEQTLQTVERTLSQKEMESTTQKSAYEHDLSEYQKKKAERLTTIIQKNKQVQDELYRSFEYNTYASAYIEQIKKSHFFVLIERLVDIRMKLLLVRIVPQLGHSLPVAALDMDLVTSEPETIIERVGRSIKDTFVAWYAQLKEKTTQSSVPNEPAQQQEMYYVSAQTHTFENKGYVWQSALQIMYVTLAQHLFLEHTPIPLLERYALVDGYDTTMYQIIADIAHTIASVYTSPAIKQGTRFSLKKAEVQEAYDEFLKFKYTILTTVSDQTSSDPLSTIKKERVQSFVPEVIEQLFKAVSEQLRAALEKITITSGSVEQYYASYKAIEKIKIIVDYIDKAELQWYPEYDALKRLFQSVFVNIDQKKNELIIQLSNDIKKQIKTIDAQKDDFGINRDQKIEGAVARYAAVAYKIELLCAFASLCFSKSNKESYPWQKEVEALVKTLMGQLKIFEGNRTLRGQVVYPLLQKMVRSLTDKAISAQPVRQKIPKPSSEKSKSTNPFD